MLRAVVGLVCGGLAGGLIGLLVGRVVSGSMLGSMLGLAGLLPGAFVGWRASLLLPGRPDDQLADYDDSPPDRPA
jgi:hypothetical protein